MLTRRQGTKVNIGDIEYELVFSLGLIDAILDRYGSMGAMGTALTGLQNGLNDHEAVDTLNWLLVQMLNEDIEVRNENGENLQPFTEKRLKHTITIWEYADIATLVQKAVAEGQPDLGDEKN